MKILNRTIILALGAILLAMPVNAQQLQVKEKTLKVEQFPEYIVIQCDNILVIFERTMNIIIPARNSDYEKALTDLQNVLDEKVRNHTDLLNDMSKLGFDYLDAFAQNPSAGASFNRTSLIFRKKEKYRN
jgi:adenylate kinase family enzyme